MATGAVRARDGRGCHVTSHRQIVVLPGGGLLLDTPGMRELQLPDDEGISEVFSDVAEFAARCRFKDCGHVSEPGCAVKAAIAAGDLPEERVEHYLKLGKEAQSFEIRQNEHQRRKSERDLSMHIRRWKGSGE
jgi:ribosome biogenesis GTPase